MIAAHLPALSFGIIAFAQASFAHKSCEQPATCLTFKGVNASLITARLCPLDQLLTSQPLRQVKLRTMPVRLLSRSKAGSCSTSPPATDRTPTSRSGCQVDRHHLGINASSASALAASMAVSTMPTGSTRQALASLRPATMLATTAPLAMDDLP